MPYRNGVAYYGAYGGDNTAFQARNSTTSRQLSESTQKLFKAIDDENLEAFKQALEVGADVNAFDKEGMTPLMVIARAYDVTYGRQPMLEKMAKWLIQNSSIDINAQSRKHVCDERQKRDRYGRLVYLFRGKEVAEVRPGYYIDCNNGRSVNNMDDQGERRYFSFSYDGVKEEIKTSKTQKNTALHIACQVGAKDMVKILLTHPDIKTDIENYEDKSPEDCIAGGFEDIIKLEFEKARKGRQLLNALANRDFYQANMLLNKELNPHCWKRNQSGEIETPFSLIIKSCLLGITENKKEVLTKLLKHKDLDFSQIKPIQAIERNPQLKQIIEQAITERLIDTINKKDLDNVKELVEDNCFMNHAVVTAALRNVNNPIESITNYLNEKFPVSAEQPLASTNDIPVGSEQVIQELKGELERTKAQLIEKERELDRVVRERTGGINKISQLERDLKQVREERDRFLSENRLLRTKSPSNKNEKPSQAISRGKELSNGASACFILFGTCAVCACLVIEDLPGINGLFAALALVLLLVGFYSLYKANTILSDVKSAQLGDLERS